MKTSLQIIIAIITILAISFPHQANALSTKKYYCIQAKISKMNLSTQQSVVIRKPIVQRAGNTVDNHWNLISAGKGYYYIRSKNSGLFLDVKGGSKAAKTIVWQFSFNGSDAQKWKIVPAETGYYYIQSKVSGLYLDVRGGSKANNAQIWQYPLNKTAAQKWRFLALGGDVSPINRAVQASLFGPQVNTVKVFNHEFNFKPTIKITTTPSSNTKVITGTFSHHLSYRPDDQYSFKAVFNSAGELLTYRHNIKRGGLSGVVPIERVVKAGLKEIPVVGKKMILVDNSINSLYRRALNAKLGIKSWEDAAKQIGIIIAVAAVSNK